jgi:hypothetical protein
MSTNYIQKATGASPTGLTDSLIFDNGTGVGIGTTSPTAQLHVTGDSRFDDTMEFFPDQGLRIDVFSNPSSDFVRFITFRQNAASAVKSLAMYAGANSNGVYGDTFIGRVDYASSSLFNRVPSAKFGGTDDKFSTLGVLIAEYNNPANLSLRRAGVTSGGAGDVYTDTGNATGLASGETIGVIYFQGLDDNGSYSSQSAEGRSAQIHCRTTEAATPTARGGELVFSTTPNGAQSPVERLFIQQDGRVQIGTNDAVADRVLKFSDSTGSSLIQHQSGGGILFCTDNSDLDPGDGVRMRIPPSNFSASSAVYVDSDGVTLTTTSPSSVAYKTNVATFEPDLSRFYDLRLCAFEWNTTGESDFGFIAEDIAETLPALYCDDGSVRGWKADRFPFFLFQALKQLKARVDRFEQRDKYAG